MPLATRDTPALLAKHGYTEQRKIGEGSFGRALLVTNEDNTKLVCKMVDVSQASPKEMQDAIREGRLLAALKHPYIVRYRESFIDGGWFCILMDYCEGGDLTKQIEQAKRKGQRIPEDQIVRWMTQALLALKYIHEKHVLHRDLKSSNFFISSSGNVKLGDFGIAKVLSCTAACARTQIGTPYYLSPEVCQEKPYGWPSDIWAMGCILYELCAQKVPFDAPNISALVQRICRGPTPSLPSGYSDFLKQLSNDMLARSPSARPSAEQILQLPRLQAEVKHMLEQAQAAHGGRDAVNSGASDGPSEHRQDVSSLAHAPSPVAAGPYADSAGSYRKGDLVEYLSSTHKDWLPAVVMDTDHEGRILIDLKPSSWLSRQIQAQHVRPRRTSHQAGPSHVGTPQVHRSPSAGGMRDQSPARMPDKPFWAQGGQNLVESPIRRLLSFGDGSSAAGGSRASSPRKESPRGRFNWRQGALARPSRAVNAAGAAIAGL